jgi:hypothetical protein
VASELDAAGIGLSRHDPDDLRVLHLAQPCVVECAGLVSCSRILERRRTEETADDVCTERRVDGHEIKTTSLSCPAGVRDNAPSPEITIRDEQLGSDEIPR